MSRSMATLEASWSPFNQLDPGPLIDIVISATDETVKAGRALGWEYPEPHAIKALLDTGSPFTIVNRIYARNRMLPMTNAGTPIKTIGGTHLCDEHSCSIGFPGSNLPRIGTIRIPAGDFNREPFHACIVGRDVLKHWVVKFDGRGGRVTITG